MGSSSKPDPAEIDNDALAFGAPVLDRTLRAFWQDVMQYMGWIYPTECSHMPTERFRSLAHVAIVERFSGLRGADKAKRVQARDKRAYDRMLKLPDYKVVAKHLEDAVAYVAAPKEMKEHVANQVVQDQLSKRAINLALHSPDVRVSEKALSTLVDRIMPRETKGGDTKILVFSESQRALLEETIQMMQRMGDTPAIEAGEIVEGEVVDG